MDVTSGGLFKVGRRYVLGFAGILMVALLTATLGLGAEGKDYRIQSGDVIAVSVWGEPNLQETLLVRPDGGVSFPLAGDLLAAGKTVSDLGTEIAKHISKYVPDPVVTVSLAQNLGNRIYVAGRVNSPGVFLVDQEVTVLQALALAGGLTPFADRRDIKIFRSDDGVQRAISFNYKEVERGKRLEQNIILLPGDTVLVQ